ncbi:hypothetical protein SARC_14528 [Sphaeroforma arctica JP610]|uniref:Uncharacterized protein n=1 Tax=Sphaeroforma arctica JP610 TaxID=667725 RepID=A0A0L0F859_9EUKA|nr:hypothetical protein SARC_14528 [Sphaeroforma arctica JP610]KNC72912.1 hypothetical protein SARC_14528 [Sphaeroforma arctica JP610]|eukprot:XP_014146814.1 hypothetical protein SARC_14528 [Sphaeroforma arctica JP610]
MSLAFSTSGTWTELSVIMIFRSSLFTHFTKEISINLRTSSIVDFPLPSSPVKTTKGSASPISIKRTSAKIPYFVAFKLKKTRFQVK